MRILFLTQVLPYPLDAGPKVRAYYVIRYMASRGHEVSLVSFVREKDSPSAIGHLKEFCQVVRTVRMQRSRWRDFSVLSSGLLSKTPFLIARDWTEEMVATLENTLVETGPYDYIHADQLWMAQYALLTRSFSFQENSPRLVLDNHNAVFQIPERLALHEKNPVRRALLNLEARKMMAYESAACQSFDHVVWVSKEDERALWTSARRSEDLDQRVIPICVDPRSGGPLERNPGFRRVTFLGGLHWPPNSQGALWFLTEVWPKITHRMSDAILTVVGKNPPGELARAATSAPNVEVTGHLEDLRPCLLETAVFVVPLLAGGGVRVKILDAWSWGLPVVTTSIGAEGLRVEHRSNVMLADSPQAFAEAVIQVLEDPALEQKLIRNGRQTVEAHYEWSTVYSAWEEIYPCASCSSSLTRPA